MSIIKNKLALAKYIKKNKNIYEYGYTHHFRQILKKSIRTTKCNMFAFCLLKRTICKLESVSDLLLRDLLPVTSEETLNELKSLALRIINMT